MPLASDFFKSNFVNAMSLEPGVRYEATIVSAGPHTFENGETALVIRTDYKGKGIALNKTRLEATIDGLGVNYDNWAGKRIAFYQGDTFYQGKPAKCVVVEPVVNDRIAAQPQARPALGQQQRDARDHLSLNHMDIRSGADTWADGSPVQGYDGPGENDDVL
jgi:hypothetical protein